MNNYYNKESAAVFEHFKVTEIAGLTKQEAKNALKNMGIINWNQKVKGPLQLCLSVSLKVL